MSIPNYLGVVRDLAAQYPDEWRAAHANGPQTEAFIRRLAWVLHQRDPRVGLNGKRGNPSDISDDVICYDGVSERGDVDPTRGNAPVTVIDVIASAGSPNASPAWFAVGPATPHPHAAWVRPTPVGGETPAPGPTPTPTPGTDLTPVLDVLRGLEAVMVGHGERLRDIETRLSAIMDEQEVQQAEIVACVEAARQARNVAQNISDRMEAGLPIVEGRAGWAGAMSGKVKG